MLPAKFSKTLVPLVLGLTVLSLSACGGAQSRKLKHLEKGQAFLAGGKFEKARVEFQNALQIAPTDPEARFENGLAAEKLGKIRDAAQFYQGALDVDAGHVGARANLARLYLLGGATQQALDMIKPGLEQHPDDPELLVVRAAARARLKDFSGAQQDAERAVQLAPLNENAVAALAGIYTSQGLNDKAQALLEEAVKRIASSIDLRLVLAQVYAQGNRTADAEGMLLQLVKLQPQERAHRLRLAQFYARLSQADAAERTLRQAIADFPEDRSVKLALVDFLAARRDRATAQQELLAMIKAAPRDYELKFALAKFYEDGKEFDRANALYQQVIDAEGLDSAGLSARDHLAAARVRNNDLPGALKLAAEVLNKSPRDDDALLIRGDIALLKQDPRSAIADLRAVLRDQPNAVSVLRTLARAHLSNGEPAVAEETMRTAVENNPNNAALQLDYAELLAQLGKFDQARTVIAALLKQKPDSLEALNAQFRLAMTTHDSVSAKSAAEAVVALRPKQAIGYLYQGMSAEADKHNEEALHFYSTAADLDPDAAEPLEAVVRLLANSNRLPEALKRLDNVAATLPSNSLALDIKGELLTRTGHAAQAQEAFTQALARTPRWWRPYRGMAAAQLAAKENVSVVEQTLRDAKTKVDDTEELSELLATLLEGQGKTDQAIEEYDYVIKHYPQSEVAVNNLAMLLATYRKDPGSLDRATDLVARFSSSRNPSYLDTYGWVLFKRGDAAGSVPVFNRVVAELPNAAVARYHLGMAQSLTGDAADARANLSRAVNSGAQFAGLDEAKATLSKLGKTPVSAAAAPTT